MKKNKKPKASLPISLPRVQVLNPAFSRPLSRLPMQISTEQGTAGIGE
jgi:hypothetical protein